MDSFRFSLVVFLIGILLLPLTVGAVKTGSRTVTLIHPEHQRTLSTHATTVGQVLETQNVRPRDYRRIFPSLDSRVLDGMHVFLYPKKTRSMTQPKTVSFRTRYYPTNALPDGMELVIQGGRHGLMEGERWLRHPDHRVVLRGESKIRLKRMKRARERRHLRVLATGYSPHELDTAPYDDGVSALGLKAGYGVIAVDPKVIPLGAKLYVEGYGYGIAADVGGEIEGKHIDLCFDNRQHALTFGRRWTTVHIVG